MEMSLFLVTKSVSIQREVDEVYAFHPGITTKDAEKAIKSRLKSGESMVEIRSIDKPDDTKKETKIRYLADEEE